MAIEDSACLGYKHCFYCSVFSCYTDLLDAEQLLHVTLMTSEQITGTCSLLQGSNPCYRDEGSNSALLYAVVNINNPIDFIKVTLGLNWCD